VRRLTHR